MALPDELLDEPELGGEEWGWELDPSLPAGGRAEEEDAEALRPFPSSSLDAFSLPRGADVVLSPSRSFSKPASPSLTSTFEVVVDEESSFSSSPSSSPSFLRVLIHLGCRTQAVGRGYDTIDEL